MARERYLVNEEEDTIHQNQVVLNTKSEIRKNWWHYHKGIVLGIIIGAALVASFVYSIVSQVEADYKIAFVTSYALPDEFINELEAHMEDYAEDRNNDGKVVVDISTYTLSESNVSSSEDAQYVQAEITRFTADCTTAESLIFIHDEEAFDYISAMGLEGFFSYNSGEPMPDDADDYENAIINWDEFEALKDFVPSASGIEGVSAEDLMSVIKSNYRLSIRCNCPVIEKKDKLVDYLQDSEAFYERLKQGTLITEG